MLLRLVRRWRIFRRKWRLLLYEYIYLILVHIIRALPNLCCGIVVVYSIIINKQLALTGTITTGMTTS
jgi:hypothetical protein